MTAAAIAADLHAAIDAALDLFSHVDEPRTAARPAEGKWCAREILGHLVDSACNNHRRFVIGQGGGAIAFDGYEQDAWVARQRYADVPFRDLVALWAAYNRHLAHVIAAAPADALARTGRAPDGTGDVTLQFLMEDYVRHLRHHLDQLRSRLSAQTS
jgi:hypothetical protein